jgi:hypothetical protein
MDNYSRREGFYGKAVSRKKMREGCDQVTHATRTILTTHARRQVVTLALVRRGAVLSCHGGPLAFGNGPLPFGGGSATLYESFARPVVDWVFLARRPGPLRTKLVPWSGAPSESAGGASRFDNDLVAIGNRCAAERMQGQGCGSARCVLLVSPWLHVASQIEKERCSLWSVPLPIGQMIHRTPTSSMVKAVSLVSFPVRRGRVPARDQTGCFRCAYAHSYYMLYR